MSDTNKNGWIGENKNVNFYLCHMSDTNKNGWIGENKNVNFYTSINLTQVSFD